jgi:flagellar biosynthesis protein FlhG
VFDQASTLRRLMREARPEADTASTTSKGGSARGAPAATMPRVLAITGGKGGVGKTLTTANLGLCFANLGMRTLLIDGDFGLANLDVVMGVRVRHTIDDVLAGEQELSSVVVRGHDGLDVIPASSGVLKVPELGPVQKLALLDQIESLDEEYDVVLIDTPAGVSRSVQAWTSASAEVVIVASPEPTSLADAYATMKILNQTTREKRFKLVVNMARGEDEALRVYERLSSLAEEYLDVRVEYLGCVPFDEAMRKAVRERVPCVQRYPFSPAAANLRQMARQLACEPREGVTKGTAQFFWRRMVSNGSHEVLGMETV